MSAGAGAATVAWAPESDYLGGLVGSPTYRLPGTDVGINRAELSRNQTGIRLPDDPEALKYLAQNFRGQMGIQFVLNNDEFHRLVFNDSFTDFTSGTVNSAEWYLGVDHLNGTTERQIKGWVPATCEVSYNGTTEAVTVTLTGPYGDETKNTSITPGTINNDSTGTEVPGHGAKLTINSNNVSKLQSATLSFENISRLIREANDNKPVTAVQGAVTESIQMTAIYDGSDEYQLALGGTSATSVQDTIDGVSGTLALNDASGTTQADYTFGTVKPDSYNWQDLVNNEADLNEQITFNATGVTASDPTA